MCTLNLQRSSTDCALFALGANPVTRRQQHPVVSLESVEAFWQSHDIRVVSGLVTEHQEQVPEFKPVVLCWLHLARHLFLTSLCTTLFIYTLQYIYTVYRCTLADTHTHTQTWVIFLFSSFCIWWVYVSVDLCSALWGTRQLCIISVWVRMQMPNVDISFMLPAPRPPYYICLPGDASPTILPLALSTWFSQG